MSTVIDKIVEELYKERKYCQEAPASAIDRAIKIVEDHRGRLELGDSSLGGAKIIIDLPISPENT